MDAVCVARRGELSAAQKNFRRAVEITREYGDKPALPLAAQNSSIDQLRQALHANPDNYALGFQLYHEQMQQGSSTKRS